MAVLVRGSVVDRPWGLVLAACHLRGVTGQLTLVAEGKRFEIAFERGAIVAAASPLASDAAVRVALTGHLVSSSQVPEISRRQAAAPQRDEVSVIAELARLGPDHALRLRRRIVAQRAARTFSINHGDYTIADRIELPVAEGCALDARAVIYIGAQSNLSEQRLSVELSQLGGRFRLKPGVDGDLPQYGFGDVEQPVIERLRDGGTLGELESFTASFVDERTVRAVVYALAVCGACEVGAASAGSGRRRSQSSSGTPAAADPAPSGTTQPMARIADDEDEAPTTRAPTRSGVPRARPGSTPAGAPLSGRADSSVPGAPGARRTDSSAPGGPRARPPAGEFPEEPTRRERSSPTAPRPGTGSQPAIRPPTDSELRRSDSDPALRPKPDSDPALRLRSDSDPALRPPGRAGLGSQPAIRLPTDSELRGRPDSDPALRPGRGKPDSDPALRPGRGKPDSDPALRPDRGKPDSDPALRPAELSAAARRDESERRRRQSTPPPRTASSEPSGQVVVRQHGVRRPPAPRRISPSESPHSHEVKAVIAHRLKLLDQGADHFALLGVAPEVPTEALRRAYFSLARQLHPDRLAALGISDEGKHAQRLFAQINTGFAILSDPARRAAYVDVLRRGGEAAVRAEQARAEDLARRIMDAEEAFRRAELALRRDQPQAAAAELEQAVQLNPDEADYHAMLAWAQFCAAPDKAAVASRTRALLERAIQRAPRAVTARFCLGRVERILGRDQDALRLFRDVLVASPGHAEAAAELRALESRLGSDKPGGGFFNRNKR